MSTDAPDQTTKSTLLVDVADLISERPRASSRHYRFGEGKSLGYDVEQSEQPYVDRGEMSARAVISTATKDRVGDVLLPVGCNLTNYAKNPVVLWGHGIEGLSLPIGTSMKDGNLGIEITDDAVYGTCWFSQSHLEAAQVFELVCEGIVRATSVRETPIRSQMKTVRGEQVLLVHEWELEEWSWCAIGVNPDAVAKAIGKGRLAGKPITPSIMKSLNAVAPAKKPQGIGFKAAPPKEEVVMNEETDEPVAEVKSTVQPFGSQTLKAMHAALKSNLAAGEACMKAMEHPKATPGFQSVIDCLKDQITALEGLHAECYPQHAMKDDMEPDDDVDDSAMKAWLASGQTVRHQLTGVSAALKNISANDNLYPGQRKALDEIAALCARWSSQAKSLKTQEQKVAAVPAPQPALPSAEEKLQEEINKLKAALSA